MHLHASDRIEAVGPMILSGGLEHRAEPKDVHDSPFHLGVGEGPGGRRYEEGPAAPLDKRDTPPFPSATQQE